ncbi:lamin tail domain-containing protein [Reichenbachiella versicolor]|uniref:lamin tail domain-containing protein n=1 Tax=Reichenbachiella versicolor TaxID=1821036 RepID=UPI0013A53758|nr:lamin tail domain-containing protein [Reichenbachiella versicolor]
MKSNLVILLILVVQSVFATVGQRELVINEVFFDVTPSAAGFPSREFIELHNTTNLAIDITGFKINGKSIGSYTLPANGYVAVGKSSIITDFTNAGIPVVSASSFPTLINGGMQLTLTDASDNIIDSLSYTIDWYKDTDKEKGGYSIEQINPDLPCSDHNNWAASISIDGGTPGTVNSIDDRTADTTSPNISSFAIRSSKTINLQFDEPMDIMSMEGGTWILDNGLSISNATALNVYSVELLTDNDFQNGVNYKLSWSGVQDCSGNATAESVRQFSYDNLPPEINRVILRSASSISVEFNERLNSTANNESKYTIDKEIGIATNAKLDGNQVLLEFDNKMNLGQNYKLSVTGVQDDNGNEIVGIEVFDFQFEDQIDTVEVVSSSHLKVQFEVDINKSSATNPNNYEGEGIGNPISVFLDTDNPRIVNLVFQSEFEENDDLVLKVQNILDFGGKPIQTIDQEFVYDTKSPRFSSIEVLSSKSLKITFDELVERVSAESPENYEYDDTYPISAQRQSDQSQVIITFKEPFESEVEKRLYVGGISDLFGNTMSSRSSKPFIYDEIAPFLDSAFVAGPKLIHLFFHEPLQKLEAEDVKNYQFSSLDAPITASLDGESKSKIALEFTSDLPKSMLTLQVSNIQDLRENSISTFSHSIDNTKLRIGELYPLDSKTLLVKLSQEVTFPIPESRNNYHIDGKNPESINLFSTSGTIVLGENLEIGKHLLSVSTIAQKVLALSEYSFEFDPHLKSVLVPNENTVELLFDVALGSSYPVADFVMSELGHPVSVLVSHEDPELLRLVFDHKIEANHTYNLEWFAMDNFYGNTIPGHTVEVVRDATPPSVKNVKVLESNQVEIEFSEVLDKVSAEFLNNYWVDGIGYALSVEYEGSTVIITIAGSFAVGSNTIRFTNLKDLSGNSADELSEKFEYIPPYRPTFNELIISEIMAAPKEGEPEFFEVYNRSDKIISLAGLVFADGTSGTIFSSGTVYPNEHLLITNEPEFFEVEVGELKKWLTLNNGGENLSIRYDEEIIFSTIYSDSWYGSSDKSSGGYSLEIIDINNPCGEEKNWTGSELFGGTPGLKNSVNAQNPDSFAPKLISAAAIGLSEVVLTFDEKLAPLDLTDKISVKPALAIESVEYVLPKYNQVVYKTFEEMMLGNEYVVTVAGIEDCLGNSTIDNQIALWLPEQADSLDLVINEVLFNPRSGGVDFVEVYNNSNKAIDLQGWYISDETLGLKTITNEHFILLPEEYLALTNDQQILIADYPTGAQERYFEMSSFPGFNDDADQVILYDSEKDVIDMMSYDEDMHFSLLDEVEGVSLERINFDLRSDDPDTWQSAGSTVGFATPGKANSQFIQGTSLSSKIQIDPKVFFPDNTGADDFTTIKYELSLAGNFASIYIYDQLGQMVRTLANNQLLPASGLIKWDGITDQGVIGNVGYYIIYIEVHDGDGNKEIFKDTVVLGTRL